MNPVGADRDCVGRVRQNYNSYHISSSAVYVIAVAIVVSHLRNIRRFKQNQIRCISQLLIIRKSLHTFSICGLSTNGPVACETGTKGRIDRGPLCIG
jgi:hypothetical protein